MRCQEKELKFIVWLLPIGGMIVLLTLGWRWEPWQRLLAGTLGMLLLLKGTMLLRHSTNELARFSKAGLGLYLTVWPGMDPAPFRKIPKNQISNSETEVSISSLVSHGFVWMIPGLLIALVIVWNVHRLSEEWVGWMGIATLLMLIHLGYADVLTAFMRFGGWRVRRLFDEPFKSRSLTDFWIHRGNIAFVEMDRILFLKPLLQNFGATTALLCVFIISGFLHEMAISYPVQSGWGMPSIYFMFQGMLVLLEAKKLHPEKWTEMTARVWTWFWIIIPLPLLFHAPFREGLIVPLYQNLNRLLASQIFMKP